MSEGTFTDVASHSLIHAHFESSRTKLQENGSLQNRI